LKVGSCPRRGAEIEKDSTLLKIIQTNIKKLPIPNKIIFFLFPSVSFFTFAVNFKISGWTKIALMDSLLACYFFLDWVFNYWDIFREGFQLKMRRIPRIVWTVTGLTMITFYLFWRISKF